MNCKTIRISFIIPLFNNELYIRNCIESITNSVLQQDEYEIIVWNDGSSDRGGSIVQELAKVNPSIKVFSDDNHGISYARNMAMKIAKGTYIWFVDSDDYVMSQNVSEILENAERDNLEILAFNYAIVDQSSTYYGRDSSLTNTVSGEALFRSRELNLTVWRFLYKRDFLIKGGFSFSEDFKTAEDLLFNYEVLFNATRTKAIPVMGYSYQQRNTSIVHINPWRTFYNSVYLIPIIVDKFNRRGSNKYISIIVYRILKYINLQLRFMPQYGFEKEKHISIIKRNIIGVHLPLSKEGLYIYIMKKHPLLLFKVKEFFRSLKTFICGKNDYLI